MSSREPVPSPSPADLSGETFAYDTGVKGIITPFPRSPTVYEEAERIRPVSGWVSALG